MPFLALLPTTFVTRTMKATLCLAFLIGLKVQAEVVVELNSAELKVKTIRAHSTAIYTSGKKDEMPTRNLMLPRVMSQAIHKSRPSAIRTDIHVVVADDKIKALKTSTDIMEFGRFLPPRIANHVEVNWIPKSAFKVTEKMTRYWILPFGNPERNLDNAHIQDIKWTIETLENTLERLINLRYDGIEASVILDLEDGGLPAILGHWILDNINVRLVEDKFEAVDILLEARTAKGIRMGHHDHPTINELMTPAQLERRFPQETALLIDLVKSYVAKIKFAQQKTNSCDLVLTAQTARK